MAKTLFRGTSRNWQKNGEGVRIFVVVSPRSRSSGPTPIPIHFQLLRILEAHRFGLVMELVGGKQMTSQK
jgi:hypothetical protein